MHEDSHLSPITPSHSNKGIRGVRCLGCFYRFSIRTGFDDWESHKQLGRCPKNRMEDLSTDITCISTADWEAQHLGGSGGQGISVRPSQGKAEIIGAVNLSSLAN